MANRTVKDAMTVKGTNPQYLVEKIIRSTLDLVFILSFLKLGTASALPVKWTFCHRGIYSGQPEKFFPPPF